jgi:sodium-dependent dicarboxylate transporter 2/3/5
VIAVAIVTVAVWMTEPWHGVPAAVAAALPVILLLMTSVVGREDINTLDWDVLILIAGGLTLGYTLQVTGVDQRLAAVIPTNAGEAARVGVLAATTLALGTFFSNTAIASMLMPVATITAVGSDSLDLTSCALTVALVASLSMALPVSTPPNAMAYATGELARRDFLQTTGGIGLIGAALVVLMFAFVRQWVLGE